MHLRYVDLKADQRKLRDAFPESLSLRTHRALSWLHRAEREEKDEDARFVFLWIAFNAAYANEIHNRQDFSERRLLLSFLNRLIDADKDDLIYKGVWEHFPKSIRVLLGNKYVFQPFWDYQNGRLEEEEWLALFERSKYAANRALGRMDTKKVLAIVFDRLYILRNQIIHGGSTWNSGVNRSQVSDSANILGVIVPIVIHLMMENAHQGWGEPCYPVVES